MWLRQDHHGDGIMISFDAVPVYLACGPTDLRKQINGLSVMVDSVLKLDPFSPALFVFCNRNKNRIKVLFFDTDGFVLYFKRLERGRYRWPSSVEGEGAMELDIAEFSQLLSATKLERRIMRDEVTERGVA
jgi:transposase